MLNYCLWSPGTSFRSTIIRIWQDFCESHWDQICEMHGFKTVSCLFFSPLKQYLGNLWSFVEHILKNNTLNPNSHKV